LICTRYGTSAADNVWLSRCLFVRTAAAVPAEGSGGSSLKGKVPPVQFFAQNIIQKFDTALTDELSF
jgi:hypothetical protein